MIGNVRALYVSNQTSDVSDSGVWAIATGSFLYPRPLDWQCDGAQTIKTTLAGSNVS